MTMTSRSLDVSDWPVVALSYVMLSCNLICLDLWVFPLRAPCVGDVAREINSTPPILAVHHFEIWLGVAQVASVLRNCRQGVSGKIALTIRCVYERGTKLCSLIKKKEMEYQLQELCTRFPSCIL